jgi:hypothetical protein
LALIGRVAESEVQMLVPCRTAIAGQAFNSGQCSHPLSERRSDNPGGQDHRYHAPGRSTNSKLLEQPPFSWLVRRGFLRGCGFFRDGVWVRFGDMGCSPRMFLKRTGKDWRCRKASRWSNHARLQEERLRRFCGAHAIKALPDELI